MKNRVITVQNVNIAVAKEEMDDYICISDLAKAKEGDSRSADIIKNWLRNRNTLEYLGTWEQIYNPHFKVVEFDHFKMQAGLHSFVLSVSEWVEQTNGIPSGKTPYFPCKRRLCRNCEGVIPTFRLNCVAR